MSADLSRFEYLVSPGSTAVVCAKSPTVTAWVREPDGSFAQVGPMMTNAAGEPGTTTVVGGSSDLSRFVISHGDAPGTHIIPGDETQAANQLFEAGSSSVQLVAVDNEGKQLTRYCDVLLGGPGGAFDAVSQPVASEVFFSTQFNTRTSGNGRCEAGPTHPVQLFVRVNGATTLEVSKSLPADCTEAPCSTAAVETPKEAVFQGASENGARVFFTTTQPLVNEDKDTGNDLYMATIGCAGGGEGEACGSSPREVTSLVQVSHDPNPGQAAEVEPRVLAVSPDGSHVYFVARGLLSKGANGQSETPVDGAENLYVYDGASTPTFIADLCSGPEKSGTSRDVHCPLSLNDESTGNSVNDRQLWSQSAFHAAQTTTQGGFLAFSTYAQLITSGPEADTDAARDIYRYDAVTRRLQRVSIGENGFDGNGNNSTFDAILPETQFRGALQEQYELESRAISEDGSKIVFATSEPLSVRAINGQRDVYVWSEGRVGLISSGTASQPDQEPIITPSGRDILFRTSAGLAPGDTDGLYDIYDARIDGGFPPQPTAPEECSGDACQGPLSAPASLLLPGSVSQPAGGNLPVPLVVKAKPKSKTPKKRKAKPKKGKRARRSTQGTVRGRRG
jgi:hypothetical protein